MLVNIMVLCMSAHVARINFHQPYFTVRRGPSCSPTVPTDPPRLITHSPGSTRLSRGQIFNYHALISHHGHHRGQNTPCLATFISLLGWCNKKQQRQDNRGDAGRPLTAVMRICVYYREGETEMEKGRERGGGKTVRTNECVGVCDGSSLSTG